MTSVLLVYPFFKFKRDRSVFRFPPLGIAYIAAALRQAGHSVTLLDCTFLQREEALNRAEAAHADVVGLYCMVTMLDDCLLFARRLRSQASLLIAGGPLPTCNPELFLEDFDVVVRGEAEATMVELLEAIRDGDDLSNVAGIIYKERRTEGPSWRPIQTGERPFIKELDRLPFPARELLPNDQYIRYGRKKYGYSITTVMSTRGCPYRCEFCSNVVFGGSYRERSPSGVVDEIEAALALGYERISFADDVFTMKKARVIAICDEILARGLHFHWECLGRVDSIDLATALKMKQAGCTRIYFGIESADEDILRLMDKKITPAQARQAVDASHKAGLEVGAFFIVFYPGESKATVLKTLRFASALPLDYLGLSLPYPLPGTRLHERVKDRIFRSWRQDESPFGGHLLIYKAEFSAGLMWFALFKGQAQFRLKKILGRFAPLLLFPFERLTDGLFHIIS